MSGVSGRLSLPACPSLTWAAASLIAAGFFMSGQARGEDLSSWVGKRVVQKAADLVLRSGDQVVDRKKQIEIYQVEQVKDSWLLLQGFNLQGWAKPSDVLPCEKAIEYFSNEIRTNPNNVFALTMRAILWLDKREYDQAIADETAVIKLDPKDAVAYNNRGEAWFAKKDYDHALSDYNEAIRLDPKHASAFFNRGAVRSAQKDYDHAIEDYSQAIALDPNDATAFNNRGAAWYGKKDFDQAIDDESEAIKLDPNYARAFNNRADAHFGKKDYLHAIEDYTEAIKLNPNDAASYETRAWIWATCPEPKFRDGKKAVESATKACELTQWKNFKTIETLAAAYAEAGDFPSAVRWQTKAIELAPPAWQPRLRARLALFQAKKVPQ